MVMLPVTEHADALTQEDLAFALSVVLLGLLLMVSRRMSAALPGAAGEGAAAGLGQQHVVGGDHDQLAAGQ